jgi:hypothetical protein
MDSILTRGSNVAETDRKRGPDISKLEFPD